MHGDLVMPGSPRGADRRHPVSAPQRLPNAAETLDTHSHLWPSDEGRIVAAIDEALGTDVRGMCTEEMAAPS